MKGFEKKCSMCDELEQRLLVVRSRLRDAENPEARNELEKEERDLEDRVAGHLALECTTEEELKGVRYRGDSK